MLCARGTPPLYDIHSIVDSEGFSDTYIVIFFLFYIPSSLIIVGILRYPVLWGMWLKVWISGVNLIKGIASIETAEVMATKSWLASCLVPSISEPGCSLSHTKVFPCFQHTGESSGRPNRFLWHMDKVYNHTYHIPLQYKLYVILSLWHLQL